MAARIMRRVLIDFARSKRYQKRTAGAARVTFDEALPIVPEPGRDLVALDDALTALARIDARKAKGVKLRFFGGLSVEETARVLNVSVQTIMRDWTVSKAWLLRELRGRQPNDSG